MKIVNLCNFSVPIVNEKGEEIANYPNSERALQHKCNFVKVDEIEEEDKVIDIMEEQVIAVLPPAEEETFFIVHPEILRNNKSRKDLLAPGDVLRTEHGSFIGFLGFIR